MSTEERLTSLRGEFMNPSLVPLHVCFYIVVDELIEVDLSLSDSSMAPLYH